LTLISASRWSNFLHVRDHKDAEPNMELLGQAVRECLCKSKPTLLQPGEWHTPFITEEDQHFVRVCNTLQYPTVHNIEEALLKLSVARCASTSYKTVEGYDMTLERAVALHDRLVGGDPLHASPCEHQARVDKFTNFGTIGIGYDNLFLCGNFEPGWVEYRKTIPGECR
jgi:hypothetical protein